MMVHQPPHSFPARACPPPAPTPPRTPRPPCVPAAGQSTSPFRIEVSQLATDEDTELSFLAASPHAAPAAAGGQGTPRLPQSPSAPAQQQQQQQQWERQQREQQREQASTKASAQRALLHVVSDAPSLDEFLPEAFDDNDATASLAPAFSDAEQHQATLAAAADGFPLATSPNSTASDADSGAAAAAQRAAGALPVLRINVDAARQPGSPHAASPRRAAAPGLVDTAAIAAAATLSAIMRVAVNPAAMVNMLGMLGATPATLTTADLIELADTIQKHPPLMSWLTAPAARGAGTAPSSGRTTPTAAAPPPAPRAFAPAAAPAASTSGISTTPETAVLLLSKLVVPVGPETVASAQQLLKQIAALGAPGSQPTGALPFGLSQQQLSAVVDVLRPAPAPAPVPAPAPPAPQPASAPPTPAGVAQQQAQLAAMLQFSKSLPASPSAAAAAAASAGWAAATASMFPGSMKDPMQAAMTAYFAGQGGPMAAGAMDPHRIAMMSAAMLSNPMLANPAAWHNPALFMQMAAAAAAAAAKGQAQAYAPPPPSSYAGYPGSPGSAYEAAVKEAAAGGGATQPPPPGRMPSRAASAPAGPDAGAPPGIGIGISHRASLPPGMDASTAQLLASLSPKAAEALLHQMMALQACGGPPSRAATYSQDDGPLPGSLASVASAVHEDIMRMQRVSQEYASAPPPPPPRSGSISRHASSANEAAGLRLGAPPPPPPPGLPSRTTSMAAPPPPPPRKTLSESMEADVFAYAAAMASADAPATGMAAGEPAPGSSASRRYSRGFMLLLRPANMEAPELDSEVASQLEHHRLSSSGLAGSSGPLRTASSTLSAKLGRWEVQDGGIALARCAAGLAGCLIWLAG
jgi:hypothetical protein